MTPTRFRRRPQTVEAVQYDGTEESVDAIHEWLGPLSTTEVVSGPLGVTIRVVLGGRQWNVPRGDWLARDEGGRLHVLDPDDLAENYEMVDDVDEVDAVLQRAEYGGEG